MARQTRLGKQKNGHLVPVARGATAARETRSFIQGPRGKQHEAACGQPAETGCPGGDVRRNGKRQRACWPCVSGPHAARRGSATGHTQQWRIVGGHADCEGAGRCKWGGESGVVSAGAAGVRFANCSGPRGRNRLSGQSARAENRSRREGTLMENPCARSRRLGGKGAAPGRERRWA